MYGIEIIEDAIEDAKYNASMNNVTNIEFFCGDLKDVFTNEPVQKLEKPDVVILDPPRPGLHPKAIADLIKLAPKKIVYVSCNPSTLARDIEILNTNNYSVEDIQPVDMFPHTPHVENVATLILK